MELTKLKTKKDIETLIKSKWNLEKPTNFEIINWPCKYKLAISLNFLIGKTIFFWKDRHKKNKKKSIIKEINFSKEGLKIIDTNNEYWRISKSAIDMINPFTNKKDIIPLCKRHNCSNIFEDGYFIDQKDFKTLYYKTEEYQKKIKKTIKERYNTNSLMEVSEIKEKVKNTIKSKYGVDWFLKRGEHYKKIDDAMIEKYNVKHPIQSKKIKEKIKNTIKDRYGVDWFLNRGDHYKKIDDVMFTKFGVYNIFELGTVTTNSKAEKEFLSYITKKIDFKSPHSILNKSIKKFKCGKKNYMVDFYDEEENIIIEFYGNFWHCNPELFGPDFLNEVTKKTAKEHWDYDLKRKQSLINLTNCTFIEVWEKDWIEDKGFIVDMIKSNLKSK